MKQKVVVKVYMNENKKALLFFERKNKKARSEALKIAVSVHGVESASFEGADKDQIAVTGEGIDSVELTTLLRKNVGHTELVTVGPVEEKNDKPIEEATTVQTNGNGSVVWSGHPYHGCFPLHIYEVPSSEPSSPCSIM